MVHETQIASVSHFLERVMLDCREPKTFWYRGEPDRKTPLLPKLYRNGASKGQERENRLLQDFRRLAPTVDHTVCPDTDETDNWLFLAQHVGLETRLLDWSNSPLTALYFALTTSHEADAKYDALVWSLQPFELNRITEPEFPDEYPLSWHNQIDMQKGILPKQLGRANVRAAWERNVPIELGGPPGHPVPAALLGTGRHNRIHAQRGCFTIHGSDPRSLLEILSDAGRTDVLGLYKIPSEFRQTMLVDLRRLNVSHLAAFPVLDSLARELNESR